MMTYCRVLFTIELGLGQDAPTNRKTILPIADIKSRDGWMVGHLAEVRDFSSRERERGVRSLAHIQFTLATFHRCVLCVFAEMYKTFHTKG